MAAVEKSVLVPYTPVQMYELVDRVEDYPLFLPWCGGAEVHLRTAELTEATLHIRYMHIHQAFTTVNRKVYPHEMHIRLKRGPFRHMEGCWLFKPLGAAACKVELKLQYEFASHLLDKALGPVFGYIANSLVDAFVHRAEQVYGAV
ncbi:MAG: type II toxin-antitoxin system RatA family toxin [Thiobacillaceae bacterium]|nr:type II toxin-antitoxin system RatA family toxin [Thiobacillaceae bacterium]MCX7673753.1 type II toxin-antitoxin system RatA family toxin [Thiobacillaceae bacterium]MDW8323319.1 type II toxin-antitoxin system RatA family toxin [Burkholderiales bacterium]